MAIDLTIGNIALCLDNLVGRAGSKLANAQKETTRNAEAILYWRGAYEAIQAVRQEILNGAPTNWGL